MFSKFKKKKKITETAIFFPFYFNYVDQGKMSLLSYTVMAKKVTRHFRFYTFWRLS